MSANIFMSQHRDATLEGDIKSLQSKFTRILTSGCHYYNQDIANQIKQINNALDNIRLDLEFQRGSNNWRKQFDANEVQSNEISVKQLVSQGNSLTQELNTCLHTTTIQNKEENQIRELDTWTCTTLQDYLQNLQPFASGSYARLDNIAHHLGVTDRYIGFRHNLTRGGTQPLNVHTIWADRKLPRSQSTNQQPTPDWKTWVHAYRHYGPSASSAKSTNQPKANNDQTLLGYLRPTAAAVTRPTTTPNFGSRSYYSGGSYENEVRKAGLNLEFPGSTEFMDRYSKPEELPCAPYTINPQPDYTLPGRPLARLVPDASTSEYSRSYVFPDSRKIEKFPWLRSA